MNYSSFANIVSKLYHLNKARMSYFNSLPDDIKGFVVDNEFNTQTELMLDVMMKELFGPLTYEVMEFIYSGCLSKANGEKAVLIETLDDYLEYARFFFEEGMTNEKSSRKN